MILIKVDFQTKKDIAAIHWEWFKLRMTKQCPWEKKRTQSYYDFIKENVCLDSSNLSDSEYKEKLRLLPVFRRAIDIEDGTAVAITVA